MKHYLLLLLLFVSFAVQAQQDTTWFNKYWEKTIKDSAFYFRPLVRQSSDGHYLIKDYYISTGKLQEEGQYSDKDGTMQDGGTKFYYDNGVLESEGNAINGVSNGVWKIYYKNSGKIRSTRFFKNGFFKGKLISYYPNGVVERKEIWKRGRLNEAHCYTRTGKDTIYFEDFSLPRFPGGDTAYEGYMLKHMTYPDLCKKNKIHGRVYVHTFFDSTGKIYKAIVSTKVHPLLDAEALRLVLGIPNWRPAVDLETGQAIESDRYLDVLFGRD